MDESDESEGIFEKVLYFIQENPGCHLRKVKRSMSISMGTVQYQLDKLEKLGRITSTRRGLYKYYFPVGLFKENEKEIIFALFGFQQLLDYVSNIYSWLDTPATDVILSALTLTILVLFFLAIVRSKNS
jgi:hypothetical protein